MPPLRRLWDSCVVIGYLAGDQRIYPVCCQIIRQAEQGEIEILVSQLAKSECAFIKGETDERSEQLIREFFGRDYIVSVNIDDAISSISRRLIRTYREDPRIKPLDAIHLATAIQWKIPILETIDGPFARFDQLEGNPTVSVRWPQYDGQQQFFV